MLIWDPPAGCWIQVYRSCRLAAASGGCRRTSWRKSEPQQWPKVAWMSLWPTMGCYLWRQPAKMSQAGNRIQCYDLHSSLMFWVFYQSLKQKQRIKKPYKSFFVMLRKGYNCYNLNILSFPLFRKKQAFTLLLFLHHLLLQRCINVNSLLIWYPWVSIWTVKGQKGPQGEPEQANRSWINVVKSQKQHGTVKTDSSGDSFRYTMN